MTIYFIYSNILCLSTMNSYALLLLFCWYTWKYKQTGGGKRKCYASIFFVFYNLYTYTYKPNSTKHLPWLFYCHVELDATPKSHKGKPQVGLEPTTSWLEVTRAIQLRHWGKSREGDSNTRPTESYGTLYSPSLYHLSYHEESNI